MLMRMMITSSTLARIYCKRRNQ